MNFKKIIILSLWAISFQQGLLAQPDLPSEEVEVIKDFDARLEDTEKVEITPSLPKQTTTTKTQIYNIPTRTLQVEYLPPKIRPLAMKRDELPKQYNGFFKFGYGVPASPYAEASYYTFYDDRLNIGGRFRHHSANFKNKIHQRFAENEAELKGTYYLDQGYAASGNLGYTSDQVHYYGFSGGRDSAATPTREQAKQTFNTLKIGGQFFNGERTQGDINYKAGFNFYNMKDNFASRENAFDAYFGVTKWIAETNSLNLGIKTDLTTYRDGDNTGSDRLKQKLNNFYLTPSFTYHGDAFRVKLGANLVAFDGAFRFYPDVEASANIVGNKFTVFAGAEGSLQKNTMQSLSEYNPFIKTFGSLQLRNTDYNHFYAGLRGAFKAFNYKGQVGFKKAKNLALFLNDFNDFVNNDQISFNRLEVLYDTVNIFNIQGNIGATLLKNLNVGGTISINAYDLTNQQKAWHLPALEANFNAQYKLLEDKLKVKGELFVANAVPFKNESGLTDNLNTLLDLSFGAEYELTENFGAFVDVNNLLNNKRERWHRYPTYGLNVLLGITGRF